MNVRKLVAAAGFAVASILPAAGLVAPAYAATVDQLDQTLDQQVLVRCRVPDGEFTTITTQGCDLGVDKQVSVNGGVFVEADTSAAAAGAHVGDTVTYKITLSNTSSDPTATPLGKVTVHDVLPSGVTFGSAVATDGTFASNDWVVTLATASLPATLTITGTANANGLAQNTAALSDYDPCMDGCLGNVGSYTDEDSSNNSNDAWVNVQAKPQVLDASTTLVNTGSNSTTALIVAGSLVTAALFLGFATRRREQN